MQIDVIAQRTGRDNRVLLMIGSKMRECVVGFGINDRTLFDPANFVLLGLDPQEPAAVLQDLKRLPVDDFANSVGYGSNAVVKVHLSRGNIDRLLLLVA
jgi:hypothetical protein